MSPMFPITLAGVAMAAAGVPPWAWFVLIEAAVLRAILIDIFG